MRVDKEPVAENKVANESSELDNSCSMSWTYFSSKRILSSSPSSSEVEQTEADDAGACIDFAGLSVLPEANNEMNGSPATGPGRYEEHDREAIFHKMANFANSLSEGQRQMIFEITGLKIGSSKPEIETSTKSSRVSENEKISAQHHQKSVVDGLRKTLKAIPTSMMYFLTGWFRPGDGGRPFDQKPDWLDMDKLRQGQKFAQDHMIPVFFSEVIGTLAVFSFDDGLKPLIISGNSNTPYAAFKRYLSTALRMRHWYTQDPWTKATAAWEDILIVRAMHTAASRRLNSSTNEELNAVAIIPNAWCPAREMLLQDFSEACKAPVPGQCPYLAGRNNPNRPKGISQVEMALAQWTIVGLITLYPKSIGIHDATDGDLEAFCHLWRSLGYQLGMEDEYNFCRGTLREIRQRSSDFLETWIKPNLREITPEWEHMGRSLITGISVFLYGTTYETALLYLAELLDLQMPRLYASLSYKDWIKHNLTKYLFHYAIRLPGMLGLTNSMFNRALDRAENFTPDELEAVRIRLFNHPGNHTKADEKPVDTKS